MSEESYDEYKATTDFIKRCDETKEKNSQSQDKIVIAIASGLFGILLSIFDKGLIDESQVFTFKVLVVNNAITIILALLSFSIANKSIDKKIAFVLHPKDIKNHWNTLTKFFNACYVLTTIVTIMLVIRLMWNII